MVLQSALTKNEREREREKARFCKGCLHLGTYGTDKMEIIPHCDISVVKPTRCTNVSNLFYFGMTLYTFRTVFPSVIRSSKLYIQQQAFFKQILLSACFKTVHRAKGVWQIPVAVCKILNSWWTETPSETCRVSFQNKINLIYGCI